MSSVEQAERSEDWSEEYDDDRPRGWLTRTRDAFVTPAGMAALLVLAVQAVWRGGAVMGGYFTQDDFLVMGRSADRSLDADLLLEPVAGELSPVGALLAWASTGVAPLDWSFVAAAVVGLQALVSVLVWMVLTRVLGDRWVRVPLLAVYCFAPLTLGATTQWSWALLHLPTVLLLVLAVLALLLREQEGWRPGQLVAGVCLVLALLVNERNLLLPLVPFFVLAVTVPSDGSGIGARLARTASRYAGLWIVVLVAVVCRVLWGAGEAGHGYRWPTEGSTVGDVLELYARQGVTGLLGGPWTGDVIGTSLVPDGSWPRAVAIIGVVLFLVPVLRSAHPAARLGLIGVVTYCVAGGLLVVLVHDGSGAGQPVVRFLADSVLAVVLLTAVTLRKVPVPSRRYLAWRPAVTAVVLTGLFVLSASVTTARLVPSLQNSDDRALVDNIARGLQEDPRVVLLDTPVPESVMGQRFGEDARVSTVAGLLPQGPAFGLPSEHLRIVRPDGSLSEVDLAFSVAAEPSEDPLCGYAVRGRPTTVRMVQPVPDAPQVLRLGYFTSGNASALLEVGSEEIWLPVRDGLHVVDVPLQGGFASFSLSLDTTDQTVCLTSAEAGTPLPGSWADIP